MDPGSAAVAFVGLGASLVTLAALVVDSYGVLSRVGASFRSAPRDVARLCRQLAELEGVLREARRQVDGDGDEYGGAGGGMDGEGPRKLGLNPAVRTVLASVVEGMKEDLADFAVVVAKLKRLFDGDKAAGKMLEARVRHVLNEGKVREYERHIAFHVTKLNLVLVMSNGHKLDAIWRQTSTRDSYGMAAARTAPAAPTHAARGNRQPAFSWALSKKTYYSPLGIVSTSCEHVTGDDGRLDQGQRRYSLLFVPPQWLGHVALAWDLRIAAQVGSRIPKLNASLTPVTYNPSPQLLAAVTKFDVDGLRFLVREGKALLSDHIFDKRPMTLLETIASRVNQKPEVLVQEMYAMALEHGTVGDSKFATPHSRVLSYLASRSPKSLEASLDTFLRHGGSLLWRTSATSTILTLLMRHGATFGVLEGHIFRQDEPWTVEDLLPIDRWYVAVLAYTNGTFGASLRAYLDSYRNVFSSRRVQQRPSASSLAPGPFDIAAVAREVATAPIKPRLEFYRVLSKYGTRAMLAPFVRGVVGGGDGGGVGGVELVDVTPGSQGLDVNETRRNEAAPWLRLSYLSKAAKCGNAATFDLLLEAGACPTRALVYMSRHPPAGTGGAVENRKQLLLRLVRAAELHHIEGDVETPLALLLRCDEIREHDRRAAEELIGRVVLSPLAALDPELPTTLLDTYLYLAVVLDLPSLVDALLSAHGPRAKVSEPVELLKSERLVIKNPTAGLSTSLLSAAVELGSAASLRSLLRHLADTDADADNHPGLVLAHCDAEKLAAGKHPRSADPGSMWPCQPRRVQVSAEADAQMRDLLRGELERRSVATECLRKRVGTVESYRQSVASGAGDAFGGILRGRRVRRLARVAMDLWRLTWFEAMLLRIVLAASFAILVTSRLIDAVSAIV